MQVKLARHVDASIAYLSQGGAKILPLRRGDRLVVDMSPATVRAGGTDPREIEKLLERGVQVFTRRNLHAKLLVSNNSVICGSANISKNSQNVLDEAAVWTNEPAVIQRARTFIDRLCTEPVRPEYLKECKQIYRPPRFHGQRSDTARPQRRVRHAKLWIVNLYESSIPDTEIKRYEQGEAKAAKLVKVTTRSATDSFTWRSKPKMADELELGDWLIRVITSKDKSIIVKGGVKVTRRGGGKGDQIYLLERACFLCFGAAGA
jgi:hypothetical protein